MKTSIMKMRLKRLIDTFAGRPLVAILNLMAFSLGKILHRNHALETTKVILICKLVGMGSIVQITPLITALRSAFPEVRILFLTHRQNLEYCELIDEIDETLAISDDSIGGLIGSFTKVLIRMWAARVDLFINLEVYANFSSVLTIVSCARNRLGYYMVSHDQRARGIYTHMVYFNRSAPIYEVYLQAARCLGVGVPSNALIRPRITNANERALRLKLNAGGILERPYILVNPNSSELSSVRRWPLRNFAAVISALHASRPDLQFLIIGGRGEENVGAEVLSHVPDRSGTWLRDLTGQLSLVELVVLLRDAQVLLTNDSGPMHLAFSLSVPTVGLFGPVSPRHYGGIEEPTKVLLYRHLYCSPCVHHFIEAPCGGNNQCMKLIRPGDAIAAVESLLSGTRATVAEQTLRYAHRTIAFGTHQRKHKLGGP